LLLAGAFGCAGSQVAELAHSAASINPVVNLTAVQHGANTDLECRVTLPNQYTLGDNADGAIEVGKLTFSSGPSANGPWTVLSADAVSGNSCQNIALKDDFGNNVVNGHVKRTIATPGTAGTTVYFRSHFVPGGNIKAYINGVLTNQQLNSSDNDTACSVVNGQQPPNDPPSLDVTCPDSVDSGSSLSFSVSASDPNGDTLTFAYSYSGGSPGGTFDSSGFPTVVFNAPTVTSDAVVTILVTADDGHGHMVSHSCVVTIVAPPAPNQPPTAALSSNVSSGTTPLAVNFNGSSSADSDGTITNYEFDFDGDGTYDVSGTSATASHTYNVPGTYTVTLRVTDDDGAQATGSLDITVNNHVPSAAVTASATSGTAPLSVTSTPAAATTPTALSRLTSSTSTATATMRSAAQAPPRRTPTVLRVRTPLPCASPTTSAGKIRTAW